MKLKLKIWNSDVIVFSTHAVINVEIENDESDYSPLLLQQKMMEY